MDLWEPILHPRGPLTRGLRRGSQTALGTYAAYVAHGLRHPTLLRADVTAAERAAPLPGDALVPHPSWVTDFGVDVAAAPETVWPWIVQIGYGRAGWYTWFPLDNDGRPSADAIIPALQRLSVGDIIPDGPRAGDGYGVWRVRTLDPARAMVLESHRDLITGREVPSGEAAASSVHVSWAFALVPVAPASCRLRVRVRARLVGSAWIAPLARGARLLFGLGDNVMENTMLAGIRDRAQRHA